jgi:Family of unknown function (DUF6353)
MNKLVKAIPESVTRNAGRQLLVLKKQSPHILFVAGIGGIITSTILACRATLKLNQTLDDIQVDVNNVKELKHSADESGNYAVEEWRRDTVYIYGKGLFKLVQLYGVPVLIGVVSIGALTKSHTTLARRNSALIAAYAAVQQAYDSYRSRVRDEIGEERERELYHAVTRLHQTGNEEKGYLQVADPNKWSPYARFFDETSREWRKEPETNRLFVQCQQNYLNSLLQARGHVFLNEAYDALDIPRSKAGQVVGWVIGDDGDNFIDFGIFEAFNANFVNGWERSILLDFNVDGVIYDKI